MGITIDGTEYDVRVVFDSLQRSFEIVEGNNSGTALTGRSIRDILGTGYSYTMEVEADPDCPEDYDAFYEKISQPTPYHTVTMPYGQSSITFEAKILSGTDTYGGVIAGVKCWKKLSVSFEFMQPQRTR